MIRSISRVSVLIWEESFSILDGASSGVVLSASVISERIASSFLKWESAPTPVTASMRLTPEAMDPSWMILKTPIFPVRSVWVPPHSSVETPGIFTARTTSPYFSPKSAIAPSFIAWS